MSLCTFSHPPGLGWQEERWVQGAEEPAEMLQTRAHLQAPLTACENPSLNQRLVTLLQKKPWSPESLPAGCRFNLQSRLHNLQLHFALEQSVPDPASAPGASKLGPDPSRAGAGGSPCKLEAGLQTFL